MDRQRVAHTYNGTGNFSRSDRRRDAPLRGGVESGDRMARLIIGVDGVAIMLRRRRLDK